MPDIPGKAAIATLAVRGPMAWQWTRSLFKPKSRCPMNRRRPCTAASSASTTPTTRFRPSRTACQTLDRAALPRRHRSASSNFRRSRAILVPWQQFVDNAELLDLLAHAPTTRTAAILLDQVNGAWQRVMPEQAPRLAELIPLGQHLVEPWKVVIASAPNVGKSSLMNALAGFTRSIVTDTPGTTRDVVRTRIAIDGWPIELVDTAGIRAAESDVEQQGIERARQALADADLRFWLLDGSAVPIHPADASGWHFLINKSDLPPAWDWASIPKATPLSAKTGIGVPALCEWISATLVPRPAVVGEAGPCLPEQVNWVANQTNAVDYV